MSEPLSEARLREIAAIIDGEDSYDVALMEDVARELLTEVRRLRRHYQADLTYNSQLHCVIGQNADGKSTVTLLELPKGRDGLPMYWSDGK